MQKCKYHVRFPLSTKFLSKIWTYTIDFNWGIWYMMENYYLLNNQESLGVMCLCMCEFVLCLKAFSSISKLENANILSSSRYSPESYMAWHVKI